jgi:hypothetical protein
VRIPEPEVGLARSPGSACDAADTLGRFRHWPILPLNSGQVVPMRTDRVIGHGHSRSLTRPKSWRGCPAQPLAGSTAWVSARRPTETVHERAPSYVVLRVGLVTPSQPPCRLAGRWVNGCPARYGTWSMPLMVDKLLHGPTRGHHTFTVAWMVSRRAGRTFSDLVCGTGMHKTLREAKSFHDLFKFVAIQGSEVSPLTGISRTTT